MKNVLLKCIPTRRSLIQLYAALLYNAHIKGFIKGTIYVGKSKMLCVPGLNCYSCPGAVGSCPLGALQNAVSSVKTRTPYYVLGIIMLMGLILGKTICGWLCPVGLMQELVHKIPVPKVRKSRVTRILSLLKYIILIVFVLVLPLWKALENFPLPAFCKYICPAGTLEGALGLLSHPNNAGMKSMLGGLFTSKMIILAVISAACMFIYRAFCRFLCPLGAIYGLFSKFAFIGVKVDKPSCVDCGKCIRHCKMDVGHVGDHECIHCGECIDICPTDAIRFSAGKVTLMEKESLVNQEKKNARKRVSYIAWTAAIAVMAVLVWYFNR